MEIKSFWKRNRKRKQLSPATTFAKEVTQPPFKVYFIKKAFQAF